MLRNWCTFKVYCDISLHTTLEGRLANVTSISLQHPMIYNTFKQEQTVMCTPSFPYFLIFPKCNSLQRVPECTTTLQSTAHMTLAVISKKATFLRPNLEERLKWDAPFWPLVKKPVLTFLGCSTSVYTTSNRHNKWRKGKTFYRLLSAVCPCMLTGNYVFSLPWTFLLIWQKKWGFILKEDIFHCIFFVLNIACEFSPTRNYTLHNIWSLFDAHQWYFHH